MRLDSDILVGDMFTVMESWPDMKKIAYSLNVIDKMEIEAQKTCRPMEGLVELFQVLKDSGVKVAIVTRNTKKHVETLFELVGQEWSSLFDMILTRESQFSKPDKRLLVDVAEKWNMHPTRLLMVGDSTEDIECGNAGGCATCKVMGGGNEPGLKTAPALGTIATFDVSGMVELREILVKFATASPKELQKMLGWPSREAAGESVEHEGCPPPGIKFLDWALQMGAITTSDHSFPKMVSCLGRPNSTPAPRILSLDCADGGFTKVMYSTGMWVVGADEDPNPTIKRGLVATAYAGPRLSVGSLAPALGPLGHFDAAVLMGVTGRAQASSLWKNSNQLAEVASVLLPGGRVIVEDSEEGFLPLVARKSLNAAGLKLVCASPGFTAGSVMWIGQRA
jgi:HAD superfamily hydrolase (TIGR01549 family)